MENDSVHLGDTTNLDNCNVAFFPNIYSEIVEQSQVGILKLVTPSTKNITRLKLKMIWIVLSVAITDAFVGVLSEDRVSPELPLMPIVSQFQSARRHQFSCPRESYVYTMGIWYRQILRWQNS